MRVCFRRLGQTTLRPLYRVPKDINQMIDRFYNISLQMAMDTDIVENKWDHQNERDLRYFSVITNSQSKELGWSGSLTDGTHDQVGRDS